MAWKTAWLTGLVVLVGAAAIAPAAEILIAPGDVVRVEVVGEPQLSANYTVAPDGTISVPLAGRLLVGGLSASDATASLAKALAQYVKDPQASLNIVERGKLRVTVAGAVAKAGGSTVPAGTRLAEVIAGAGGILPQADAAAVRIVHTGGTETLANLVSLARGDATQNPELAQDDLVIVPALTPGTGISVVGQVKRPGLFPVSDEVSLWELISAAGGLDTAANPRAAVLTRASGERITVDLTQLLSTEGIAAGVRLRRGDSLFVPGMGLQVYVLGAVRTAGPVLLPTGASALDAVAQAGGTLPTARLDSAYVLRKAAAGAGSRVPLRLDLLLKGQTSADALLQDGDKIVIPDSGPPKRSALEKVQPYLFPLFYLFGL